MIIVHGQVHGVGFRAWARSLALDLGLAGSVHNLTDGTVEVCAQGSRKTIEDLERLIGEEPSTAGRPGQVTDSRTQWLETQQSLSDFTEE